jgi:glycogen operon protein
MLPTNDWVEAGEVVLSTDPKLPMGTPVKAGDRLRLRRQSVVVLRET